MSEATLTTFARDCEKLITQPRFLPKDDLDRWRVYSLAKLAGIVETGADVEAMLAAAPAIFAAILRAYLSLAKGTAVAWWRASSYADHPAWPSAVRSAISDVARRAELSPRDLALVLDDGPFPSTRALVLKLATERFRQGVR